MVDNLIFIKNWKKLVSSIVVVFLLGLVFSISFGPSQTLAITSDTTVSADLTGTVSISVTDSNISLTNLDFGQTETATISGETRYIFESENDGVTSADSISFNEDTTNAKAYYYLNVTSFTAPSGVIPDPKTWVLFKDTTNTMNSTEWNVGTTWGSYGTYVFFEYNVTLTSGGATITPPSGVTEEVSGSVTVTYMSSSDGNKWAVNSFILYVLKGTDGVLYFDDDSNMSETTETGYAIQSASNQGDQVNILGNPFVIASAIPTSTDGTLELYFGWFTDESTNTVVGGTTMSFYAMLAIPFGPYGTYSFTVTITGLQQP